jgi:hypothetical protein
MFWSRTGSWLDFLLWLLSMGICGFGSWLMVGRLFQLRPAEKLLAGMASGLILFIMLGNLLAHILPVELAFWGATALILLAGLASAWRTSFRSWFSRSELKGWPVLAVLLAFTLLFTGINRGLAIFDDYLHLPLISTMATGNIPPHFYFDPSVPMAYHYGLQILAASMVSVGGLFPWSAWDLSKAYAIALTLLLGWAWVRRVTRSNLAGYLGSLLITFGGGARWLLLFLPPSWLLWVSGGVKMINTGADVAPDLFTAMSRPWAIEGGGPFPFPFAFHNGVFGPVMFVLGSSGALPFLTIILLLLLTNRRHFSVPTVLFLSLVFTTLALSAEHIFVFLWIGIALAGLIYLVGNRLRHVPFEKDILISWLAILLISGVLSVVQGGFITVAVRNILLSLQGIKATQGEYDYFSFAFRWPPAIDSAHISSMSFFDPRQLIIMLAELGPALILAPFVTIYAWRRIRNRAWLVAGLGIAGLLLFLVSIFFQYGVERSGTRLTAAALWIWVLLGFPLAWKFFVKAKPFPRVLLGLVYGIAVFGGIVIFAVQMISMPYPKMTYFVGAVDAKISQMYWNRLPQDAQVMDPAQERAVTLFGRPIHAYKDFYHPWEDWQALITNPDPVAIARAGYQYMYVDGNWYSKLSTEQKATFNNPCVKKLVNEKVNRDNFRWLLDLQQCR